MLALVFRCREKLACMDQQAQVGAKPEVPCAGCRMLHRKCAYDCMLAPYFPADEPEKFACVHRVFGASNVIKMLQMVDEAWREDAVKSMVYEAHARLRNPVYGCTVAISYLQKCVEELEGQLKSTREQVLESQEQRDQLLSALTSIYLPATDMECGDNTDFSFDSTMVRSTFAVSKDYCQII